MTTINLLPESYVKQRFRYRVDMFCVVLFAMVMGVLIIAEHMLSKQYAKTLALHGAINKRFVVEEKLLDKSFRLQARKEAFLEEARTISAVVWKEEHIPRSYILANITKACPLEVSLDKIKIEMMQPMRDFRKKGDEKSGSKVKKKSSRARRQETPAGSMIRLAENRSGRTIDKTLPHVTVRIEGHSKNDEALAQFYSDLSANPLFELCTIDMTEDHTTLELKDRKFQIWIVLRRGIDIKNLIEGEDQERQRAEKGKPKERANG